MAEQLFYSIHNKVLITYILNLTYFFKKKQNVVLWNVMIMIYGDRKLGQRANEAFRNMCGGGIVPNKITFVNLLSSLAHSGK